MRLILLRHGQTEWNALDRYQGGSDVELNRTGERQARAAAAGPVGDLLQQACALRAVTSPLVRARRTAEIVLEDSVGAADLTVDPELRELGGGAWEGLEMATIAQRWPREHHAWRTVPDLDAGPVGGEVLRVGGQRVLAAAARHAAEAGWPASDLDAPGDDGPRTLLVVAHGAVIRAAVGLALGREGPKFAAIPRIDNARAAVLEGAFTRAGGSGGPGRWSLVGYGI